MQLFASKNLQSLTGQKYVFLDNDFLNCLFKNEDFFETFFIESKLGCLLYDPLIEFEFLRDIFVPKEVFQREKFLKLSLFIQVEISSIFMKLHENALLLSKILALGRSNNYVKKSSPSLTDLYLMSRMMTHDPKNHLLITGNKKDFPSYLFDTEEVISAYDESAKGDSLLNFYILRFNKSKFEKEYARLINIGSK